MTNATVEQASEVKMVMALLTMSVARNTALHGSDINVFAHLAAHADEDGTIRIETDPLKVAAALGLGRTTVFRSYARLHARGIIEWVRARGNEKAKGISGKVRIVVPDHATA